MKIIQFLGVVLASSLASGCMNAHIGNQERYFSTHRIHMPDGETVQSCRGYGCKFVDQVTLSDKEWRKVEAPFKTKAKDAAAERAQIKASIAAFEQIVGEKTGTEEDRAGTFEKLGLWQQDCVDESTNTSIYMTTLQKRGHIAHHDINTPHSRLNFLRWPHQTAVITEISTGDRYAVDSWFSDNGAEPVIVPFEQWNDGWNPDKEG